MEMELEDQLERKGCEPQACVHAAALVNFHCHVCCSQTSRFFELSRRYVVVLVCG